MSRMDPIKPYAGRPTFAEIDLEHLRSNLRAAREFIGPELKYMAVVKADAYGHGAVECARAFEQEGVDWLGVALIEEGLELRRAGVTTPILCFGSFYEGEEPSLIEKSITPVIFDHAQARSLDAAAKNVGGREDVHVKIDTGMGRVGVRWDAADEFVNGLARLENINIEGLMTHFAAADNPAENDFTDEQIRRFYEVVEIFQAAGFSPTLIDLANSPGAVGNPRSRGNMVRLGGILYGLGDVLPAGIAKPELRPVMSLHSRIAFLKRVPKGETLGYGRTFRTERDSSIATIPIGYHDGYRRALSNTARAIVNETYAPVVGRVSMDWTIIDVTDIPDAAVGDDVVLIGRQGGLSMTAEELAKLSNTISYEVTCGISRRVPRRFIGK